MKTFSQKNVPAISHLPHLEGRGSCYRRFLYGSFQGVVFVRRRGCQRGFCYDTILEIIEDLTVFHFLSL